MARRTLTVLTLLTLLILAPVTAFADDEPSSASAEPRWRFQAWTGFLPGNPGSGLEDQLRGAGFGVGTSAGGCLFGCSTSRNYPYTNKGYFPWGLELGYRLRPALTLSGIAARTELGTTTGANAEGAHLYLDRSVQTYAVLASWTPTDRLRIGAGPAMHRLQLDPRPLEGDTRTTRFGALVDVTFDVLRGRHVTLSAKAQYRYTGSIPAGPYTIPSYSWLNRTESTLGQIDVSYDHLFLGASVGLRF
jgi:hypothetical protein